MEKNLFEKRNKALNFFEMLFTYLPLITSNWTSFPEKMLVYYLHVCVCLCACVSTCTGRTCTSMCVFVTFTNGWVHR